MPYGNFHASGRPWVIRTDSDFLIGKVGGRARQEFVGVHFRRIRPEKRQRYGKRLRDFRRGRLQASQAVGADKGRDGVDSPPGTVCKLKAGPLWDQELFEVNKSFNSKDMYYYKYLFQDPVFVETVKARWPAYRDNILGNDQFLGMVDYLNEMVNLIRESANRDTALWGNDYFTLSGELAPVRIGFVSKIKWMDQQIAKF